VATLGAPWLLRWLVRGRRPAKDVYITEAWPAPVNGEGMNGHVSDRAPVTMRIVPADRESRTDLGDGIQKKPTPEAAPPLHSVEGE